MATTNITWQGLENATINGSGYLEKNAGIDDCGVNSSSQGDAGAYSVQTLTGNEGDWAFTWTLGPDPSGRTSVGLDQDPLDHDIGTWDYTLAVSTALNTLDPFAADSIFVFDGTSPSLGLTAYEEGTWNEGDTLAIACINGQIRYYHDCNLIYASPRAPTYPLYAVASFACLNKYIANPKFITGSNVLSGNVTASVGTESGDACSPPWVIPTASAFPFPAAGGPQHAYFAEIAPDWSEFTAKFSDGSIKANTIQTARIRRFVVEWTGLSAAQAATLDAHWSSTRGGLGFTMTNPRTAEVLTNVKYERYERSNHVKYWSQERRATLIKRPV